jgi:5-methylcytosine-specific restriction endonuclease McrA
MGGTGRKRVYGGPWPRIRRTILERDAYTCQIGLLCCTRDATCVDHITPVSWGGAWYDPSNLRAACRECNDALAKIAQKHRPGPDVPKTPMSTPARAIPQLQPSRTW